MVQLSAYCTRIRCTWNAFGRTLTQHQRDFNLVFIATRILNNMNMKKKMYKDITYAIGLRNCIGPALPEIQLREPKNNVSLFGALVLTCASVLRVHLIFFLSSDTFVCLNQGCILVLVGKLSMRSDWFWSMRAYRMCHFGRVKHLVRCRNRIDIWCLNDWIFVKIY